MTRRLDATEIAARPDLDDWSVLGDSLVATLRAGSFSAATGLAHEIAQVADEVRHHPDIDIRYPDRVRVVLTTHGTGGITDEDVSLALSISRLAATASAVFEPGTAQAVEVAIDALEPEVIRPFWKAVLGYVDPHPDSDAAELWGLVDPIRVGPSIWFQQMVEARPHRSRTHVDVLVAPERAAERLEGALAAGGRMVTDAFSPAFWVLADAEGNEACVCTHQGRD